MVLSVSKPYQAKPFQPFLTTTNVFSIVLSTSSLYTYGIRSGDVTIRPDMKDGAGMQYGYFLYSEK